MRAQATFYDTIIQKDSSSHCLARNHLVKWTDLTKYKFFKKETGNFKASVFLDLWLY